MRTRDPYTARESESRDPHNPFSEKDLGLAMMGMIFFCAASGLGLGVFLQRPVAGGLIGGALGILVGLWLVPALLRDWHD